MRGQMMRLIDADIYVTANLYDDEHEEYRDERMTIADCLDRFTDEGCPTECKPKQEWIPCSERPPSDEEGVMAWVESGNEARIACCNYAHEVWFDVIMNVKVSPIAWMPLPEPYKEK